MKKYDKNKYNIQYKKTHYKRIVIESKPQNADIIAEYCKNKGITKSSFLIKSALYIINHDIDISDILL